MYFQFSGSFPYMFWLHKKQVALTDRMQFYVTWNMGTEIQ